MNRVENVSIGGYAFTLEQKAYEKASAYLNGLNRYYKNREDGEEVVEELEERFAELIRDRRGIQEVISESVIKEAIAILGKPEAFDEAQAEGAISEEKSDSEWRTTQPPRRLYRCQNHRRLGGVASGLALYFKIDVTFIRLGWIALALTGVFLEEEWLFFASIIAYLAFWIAMPKPGNIREIEKQEQMRNFVKGSEAGNTIGKALRVVFGILMILTGGLFLLTNIAVLVGVSFWDTGDLLGRIAEDYEFALPIISSTLFRIELWFVMLLPFIVLLYEGIRLLFEINAPSWHPGLIMTILWLISLLAIAVTCTAIFLNLA